MWVLVPKKSSYGEGIVANNRIKINSQKAFIWGTVAIFIQMCVYYVIWMNPYVNDISLQFGSHPSVKPYEYFGGLQNWMQLRTLYLIIMLAVLIKIYLMFYSNIPGNRWQKGLWFGSALGVVKVIPGAFNTWTLVVYPNELIQLQLINGIVGYILFGVIVSTIFNHFNVIEEASYLENKTV